MVLSNFDRLEASMAIVMSWLRVVEVSTESRLRSRESVKVMARARPNTKSRLRSNNLEDVFVQRERRVPGEHKHALCSSLCCNTHKQSGQILMETGGGSLQEAMLQVQNNSQPCR